MVKNFQSLRKSPGKSKRRSLSLQGSKTAGLPCLPSSSTSPMAANINVAVRVRPENSREEAGAYSSIINVVDSNMLVFDPQDGDESVFFYKGKRQGMRDLNKKAKKDKKYTFDNVFGPESTNLEVFERTTKNVVTTLFEGYNCCVFAYGATGAGKTFTMLGAQDKPGIILMTMEEIFLKIEEREDTCVDISMSYLEVYNETITDLLDTRKNLDETITDLLDTRKNLVIREDNKNGTNIPGLSVHKPKTPDEVLKLLSYGNSNRTQHPTDHNKESSRSHAVLQIIIQQKAKDSGLSAEVKTAKLSMIDLAGSEKGAATGHKGARFREGANINKSLLALGNCINALASGSKYIPYRDSKLTRLLKDSIGGNCATVMIANISPSSITYEDTLNTLKYADRAKKIKVDLKKNILNVDFHIAQYADLRTEILSLKQKIHTLEEENLELKGGNTQQGAAASSVAVQQGAAASSVAVQQEGATSVEVGALRAKLVEMESRQRDYDDLQRRLAEYERDNANLKASMIQTSSERSAQEQESRTDPLLARLLDERRILVEKIGNEKSLLSSLELRAHFKRMQGERCELVSLVQMEKNKSVQKTLKNIESLQRKIEKKQSRVDSLMEQLAAKTTAVREYISNNPASLTSVEARTSLALDEYKAENSLLHEVIHIMEAELTRVDQQLLASLPILVKNEKLLRGHGIQSKEEKDRFSEFQDLLQGNQQVTWAENINNSVSAERELVPSIYNLCSRVPFPNLECARRPSSVEQKNLFPDQTINITNQVEEDDEMDSVMSFPPADISVPTAEIPVKAEISNQPSRLANKFQSPPLRTLQLENSKDDTFEALPATPITPLVRGFQTLFPPTPQLARQSSLPPVLTVTNKSFAETPDSSSRGPHPAASQLIHLRRPDKHVHGGSTNNVFKTLTVESRENCLVGTGSLVGHNDVTSSCKTLDETNINLNPKRLANFYAEDNQGTPEKKRRLDETYCPQGRDETFCPPGPDETNGPPQSAVWLTHRPVAEIPESPIVSCAPARCSSVSNGGSGSICGNLTPILPDTAASTMILPDTASSTMILPDTASSTMDQTFTAAPNSLNETVVLTAQPRTDEPKEGKGQANLNSTFCVDEEPMDVDGTRALTDMSIIQLPRVRTVRLPATPQSPVRAGLGLPPVGATFNRKSPSPLRQSTLLDLKAGLAPLPFKGQDIGSKERSPQQQQQHLLGANKLAKKTLRPSCSTSALPRPGGQGHQGAGLQPQQVLPLQPQPQHRHQPVSFRSTIQRVVNKDTPGEAGSAGSNYMQPTTSSSLKRPKGSENTKGSKSASLKRSLSTVFKTK